MKLLTSNVLAAAALCFAACSQFTPEQQAHVASVSSTIGAQVINAAANLGIAKLQSSLNGAGNPYADSAALGLRTLQGTNVITPAQIQTAIATFGDPNTPKKWSALGKQVAQIVEGYAGGALTNAAIEAAATALNQLGVGSLKGDVITNERPAG